MQMAGRRGARETAGLSSLAVCHLPGDPGAVTLASPRALCPLQEPFYVRCIKPNEDKVAEKLDEGHCRHQVAYLGLLENVRVRRAGFASHQPYPRFLLRYGPSPPWAFA